MFSQPGQPGSQNNMGWNQDNTKVHSHSESASQGLKITQGEINIEHSIHGQSGFIKLIKVSQALPGSENNTERNQNRTQHPWSGFIKVIQVSQSQPGFENNTERNQHRTQRPWSVRPNQGQSETVKVRKGSLNKALRQGQPWSEKSTGKKWKEHTVSMVS